MKVLCLNASEEIHSLIEWDRALRLLLLGKARRPYGFDDEYEIKTTNGSLRIPSAVVLVKYVHVPRRANAVNKSNLLKRDSYTCQYCGKKLTDKTGTIEHIMPTSRGGGKHDWKNVVAACGKCNNKKANKTPEEAGMKLRTVPSVPSQHLLLKNGREIGSHKQWERWV